MTLGTTTHREGRMTKLKVLDLFSGIGGFSLGLERTGGFETVAFCEIEPFCRRVLAKHWPEVPCYDDVRTLSASRLAADGIAVDAVCGGFPCQDISSAGNKVGISGERSGLWREYSRLIGELRPSLVFVENVSALLSRGLGDVLGDLAALGYDADWHCIPATFVGAPQRRDRLWLVAHANSGRGDRRGAVGENGGAVSPEGLERLLRRGRGGAHLGHADSAPQDALAPEGSPRRAAGKPGGWPAEPDVGRMAHGVPARVDRLRALGNAVVPQVVELLGRAILDAREVRHGA